MVLSVLDIIGTLVGNLILNHIDETVLKVTIFSVLLLSGLSSFVKIKSTKKEFDYYEKCGR